MHHCSLGSERNILEEWERSQYFLNEQTSELISEACEASVL